MVKFCPCSTWSPDGTILMGMPRGEILRVSAAGAVPAPLSSEIKRGYPHFLPDGKTFIYMAGDLPNGPLMLASLDFITFSEQIRQGRSWPQYSQSLSSKHPDGIDLSGFPCRPEARGERNQNEQDANSWPAGSAEETVPSSLCRPGRCDSAGSHFPETLCGWSAMNSPDGRGSSRDRRSEPERLPR
jgi:hypothetical protein